MKTKALIVLILLILLAIILVQNAKEVEYRIFFWKITMSRVVLVPLAVVVGFLFGYFIAKAGMKKLN